MMVRRLMPTLVVLLAAGVCQAADAPLYKVVDGYKELAKYTELGGSLTVFALPN